MHPATLSLPVAMLSLHCAANSPTDLASLLRNRQLALNVKGVGGHSGECVNVSVHNLRSDSLTVRIPAGWRFVSQDSTLQDL